MVLVTMIISCIPAHAGCCSKHLLCVTVTQNSHNPMKPTLLLLPFYR